MSDRGERIADRLKRLGMSVRQFAEQTGLDRGTINRAISGEGNPRSSTFQVIEAALADLEHEVGEEGAEPGEGGRPGTVSFRIGGNFGVDVVIEGPVENMAELQAAVSDLMREMRDNR